MTSLRDFPNGFADASRRARRFAMAAVAAIALGACTSSETSWSACAQLSRGEPTAPRPSLHVLGIRDPEWPTRISNEVAAMRADTTVRLLLIHRDDVKPVDRDFALGYGPIDQEPDDWNGIVVLVTPAKARELGSAADTQRIYDAHLVSVTVLPPCQ